MSDTKKFTGKVFIVTGASGAIGKESAFRLANLGATVILMGRKEEKLNQIYDIIVARGNPEPVIVSMDFNKVTSEDYYGLAHNIAQEFPKIDGIIHTAVNLGNLAPLAHTEPAKWDLSINLALNAPFYLTQAMLPLLHKAEPRASVIFFEHNEVASGKAYWGSYAVAKAGIATLKRLFAEEYEAGQAIQFNSIDPVRINSALQFSVSPTGAENPKSLRDVCNLVEKLCDTEHEYINGETFTL